MTVSGQSWVWRNQGGWGFMRVRSLNAVSKAQDHEQIRVLVGVQSPILLAGIRTVLLAEPDLTIAGSAGSCAELINSVRALPLPPHAILVDTTLDGLTETCVGLCDALPEDLINGVVLLFARQPSTQHLRAAAKIGVRCAAMADDQPGDIRAALGAASRRCGWISPRIGSILMRSVLERTSVDEPPSEFARLNRSVGRAARRTLTNREKQVLPLLVEGRSDLDIGHRLHLSERAVKYHVQNLIAKHHARNRTHLAALTVRAGFDTYTCPTGQVELCPNDTGDDRSPVSLLTSSP